MRKLFNILSGLMIILIVATSCGKEDINQLANATSQQCQGLTGAQAIYWDIANGIIRTDLPGGIPPQINNYGGTFSHQDFPLLGFNYPVGWTPTMLNGAGIVGVNLIRNDDQGIWRYIAYPVNNGSSVRQIRDFEINAFMDYFGLGNNYETICTNQQVTNPVPGIAIATDNIILRAGGMTALVIVSLTAGDGFPSSQANVKVSVAPTNEFNDRVWDTFLAIEWQLLFGNPDTLYDGDRDNDGTPDVYDNFPDDPTRA